MDAGIQSAQGDVEMPIDRRNITDTEWDEARERLKAEVEGCPPSFDTPMDDVVIWLFLRVEDLARQVKGA